jgi:hypothetical protein
LWRADTGEAEGKIIRHGPIEGDPAQLLEEWQKKLSLKLDEKTGKIEPMYPLPLEKDKSPFPRVKIENK